MTGNLFSCPVDEALAHCISEDCRMGAGIAVIFKQKFGRVGELKEQSKTALFILRRIHQYCKCVSYFEKCLMWILSFSHPNREAARTVCCAGK